MRPLKTGTVQGDNNRAGWNRKGDQNTWNANKQRIYNSNTKNSIMAFERKDNKRTQMTEMDFWKRGFGKSKLEKMRNRIGYTR